MQNVTDTGLLTTISSLTHLKWLDLSCLRIHDDSLHAISHHLTNLHELRLSFCPNITSSGLESLYNLPKLQRCILRDNALISTESIIMFNARLEDLQKEREDSIGKYNLKMQEKREVAHIKLNKK